MTTRKKVIVGFSVVFLVLLSFLGVMKWREYLKTSITSDNRIKLERYYYDPAPVFEIDESNAEQVYVNKSVYIDDSESEDRFHITLMSYNPILSMSPFTAATTGGIHFSDDMGQGVEFGALESLVVDGVEDTNFTVNTDESTYYTFANYPNMGVYSSGDNLVWDIPDEYAGHVFALNYYVVPYYIDYWEDAPYVNDFTRAGMIESNYGCSASYILTNPSSYVAINEQKDSLDDNYFWEDYNDYSQVDYSRLSSYDGEGNEVTVELGNRGYLYYYGAFTVTTYYEGLDDPVDEYEEQYYYGENYCGNDEPDFILDDPDAYTLDSIENSNGTENLCGTIDGDDIYITLTYEPGGSGGQKLHYVFYYIEDINILSTVQGEASKNSEVCPPKKTFPGYTYITDIDECYQLEYDYEEFYIELEKQNVTQYTVTTYYYDLNGNQIRTPVVDTYNDGDEYYAIPYPIDDYELDSDSGNIDGIVHGNISVYFYYRYTGGGGSDPETATVQVDYVDENNTPIASSLNTTVDKTSTTCYNPTTIQGYEFVNTTGDAACLTGNKDSYHIIHHYRSTAKTVTVYYYDENNNPVHDSTSSTYAMGATYNVTVLDILNYDYSHHGPNDITGTVTDNIDVYLYYTKKTSVITLNYYFDGYLNAAETVDAYYGDPYDVTSYQRDYPSYSFTRKTGDDLTGTVNKPTYTINFYYVTKTANFSIHYYFDGVNTTNESLTMNYREAYDLTSYQRTYDNYNFDHKSGDDLTGTVNKDNYSVSFYYVKKTATITVHTVFMGENETNETITVNYGDPYDVTSYKKTYTGYSFYNQDGDPLTGTVSKDTYQINLYYQRNSATISIHYFFDGVDTSTETVAVTYGSEYNVLSYMREYPNYRFDHFDGDDLTGTVNKDNYVINLYYVKKTATITIHTIFASESENTETLTVNYGDPYDVTSYKRTYEEYSFYSQEGDPLTGTVSKDNYSITLYYVRRGVNITVSFVDENNHSIRSSEVISVPYHDNIENYYLDPVPTIQGYEFLRVEHDGETLVDNTNTMIQYIYHLKTSVITVHYVDESRNPIDEDHIIHKNYNETYSVSAKTIPGYTYQSRDGDAESGTVSQDTYTITYIYKVKSATITVHHYVSGTTTKVSPDQTQTKNYFESYSTSAVDTTSLDYEYDSVSGDDANGTVNKDTIVVTYYYTVKHGTLKVYHYLYDGGETATEVAPATTETKDYGSTYTTSSSDVALVDYDFHSRTNNYTGVFRAPLVEVKYYYQPKSSTITAVVRKEGTEAITSETEEVAYVISYEGSIKFYEGDATITIVDTLPKAIDVDQSNLSGGTYNENDHTITWTTSWTGINVTHDAATKNITKNITLVYEDVSPLERTLINQVKATTTTSEDSYETTNQASTAVQIKGAVISHFLEKGTNEVLAEDYRHEDLVGERYVATPAEIPGYEVVERPDSEEFTISKTDQELTYYYEKIHVHIETVVNGTGGKIEGDEEFLWGEDSTEDKIKITADEGYVIMDVFVNGVRLDIPLNQTEMVLDPFKNMTENKLIEVTFHYGLITNPETSNSVIWKVITVLLIPTIATIAVKKQETLKRFFRKLNFNK